MCPRETILPFISRGSAQGGAVSCSKIPSQGIGLTLKGLAYTTPYSSWTAGARMYYRRGMLLSEEQYTPYPEARESQHSRT